MKEIEALWEAVLSFLFPPRCPKCRRYVEKRGGWCESCLQETICVRPFQLSPEQRQVIDAGWVISRYHGPLRGLILGLKYHGRKENLLPLSTLLESSGANLEQVLPALRRPEGLCAVCVPLWPKKQRARGFNQVELIFRSWLSGRGIRLVPALVRTRETRPQYGLSRPERRKNVSGAFSAAAGAEKEILGRNILLLDDIVTTGTTALYCAKALRKAGARSVTLLALCSDQE